MPPPPTMAQASPESRRASTVRRACVDGPGDRGAALRRVGRCAGPGRDRPGCRRRSRFGARAMHWPIATRLRPGRDAAAAGAAVDLDEHLERGAVPDGRRRQVGDRRRVVDAHDDPRVAAPAAPAGRSWPGRSPRWRRGCPGCRRAPAPRPPTPSGSRCRRHRPAPTGPGRCPPTCGSWRGRAGARPWPR